MSAMIKMFAAQIDRIAPTPRERALLSALCAVGAIALAVEAGAYALQSRSALLDAVSATMASQRELAALRDPRHRAELASVAGMARDRSFDDPTLAIAAVRAQSDLEALARAAGLDAVRVSVLPADEGVKGSALLRLTLESGFEWSAFDALLTALAGDAQSYVVDAIEVDEEAATLRLTLRAAYQRGEGAR
jgi:hypothetical protein